LFQEAGVDEDDAFAPLRALFAAAVTGDPSVSRAAGLSIEFALGGIHSGAIAVAHMPKSRRGRAIDEIVDLVTRCLIKPRSGAGR
jgi:hypothetical protein